MGTSNPAVTDWLRNAYSMELGLIPVLEEQASNTKVEPQAQKMIGQHLQETRRHAQLLKERLEGLGERTTSIKPSTDVITMYHKTNGMNGDHMIHTALAGFVTESFEVASYKALGALARRSGDQETAHVADQILKDEVAAVQRIGERVPDARLESMSGSMADGEMAGLARSMFDALNEHDLNKWSQYIADSYRGEAPGAMSTQNKQQAREYNQIFLTAFPDLHFSITQTVVQNDRVAIHWEATGTHRGQLPTPMGEVIQPTGRKATGSGCSIFEVKNGKVTRGWLFWDMATLLSQIGVLPVGQSKSMA